MVLCGDSIKYASHHPNLLVMISGLVYFRKNYLSAKQLTHIKMLQYFLSISKNLVGTILDLQDKINIFKLFRSFNQVLTLLEF